ncbi:hypothetical protein [Saccharothrix australiensis]|uniref:hypothetical protein n=1 Tax=Saccharothrix australiensis TaxID=2072 RepID=UPI0011C4682D|nr:hypothetical protein [Saccharothrix australiensis]
MPAHRTRALVRAAALLAAGASPLLFGAASAAQHPLDVVDGTLRAAPEVGGATAPDVRVARPAPDPLGRDLLGGEPVVREAVKLPIPSPLPVAPEPPARSVAVAAPEVRDLPVRAPAQSRSALDVPALAPPAEQLPALPIPPVTLPPLG